MSSICDHCPGEGRRPRITVDARGTSVPMAPGRSPAQRSKYGFLVVGRPGPADPRRSSTGSADASGLSGSGVPGHLSARVAAIARRFFPWVVVDLPLVWSAYALALLVRGVTITLEYAPALGFAALAAVVVVACNEAFGIYRRWWRFATSQDLVPLTVSMGVATVAIVGLDLAWPGFRPMPLSTVFLG